MPSSSVEPGVRTQGPLCEMISPRDAQGQHEVAHICLTGETYRLKKKWRLGGQENERIKGVGATYRYLRVKSLWAVLLFGPIAEDCLTSRPSKIVTDLMFVLSTRPNIM